MFDTSTHQGIGLGQLAHGDGPRVVALASHGDQDCELPLLWDLCSTYTGLGYSVAVIDATTFETEGNPGLGQLLDQGYWNADHGGLQSAWPVIPAGRYLARLAQGGKRRRMELGQLTAALQSYNVVVVYARPENLMLMLTGSSIKPVLAVSAARMSRVTAYHALKLLLLNGRLHPTIVAMVGEGTPDSGRQTHSLCKNLQDCAMTFLGYQLDTLTVKIQRPDGGGYSSDMHSLALHVLENGVPDIDRTRAPAGMLAFTDIPGSLAGKH